MQQSERSLDGWCVGLILPLLECIDIDNDRNLARGATRFESLRHVRGYISFRFMNRDPGEKRAKILGKFRGDGGRCSKVLIEIFNGLRQLNVVYVAEGNPGNDLRLSETDVDIPELLGE